MRTIRSIVSVLGTLTLALLCSLTLYASDSDAAGRYYASECSRDGNYYECEGEYLLLEDGGKGEAQFNGVVRSIEWKLDGKALTFTDEDDENGSGTLEGSVINLTYYGYDYVYVRNDSSLSGGIDDGEAAASSAGDEGTQDSDKDEIASDAAAGTAAESSGSGQGAQKGPEVFLIESRENGSAAANSNGEESVWRYDYIALNDDGSGVFMYNKAAFGIRWKLDGDAFSFTDHKGNSFDGTMKDGTISGAYSSYRYTFRKSGAVLPAYNLSPEDWGSGLPEVVDEAGVLSDDQELEFTRKAQELADEYDVGVYVVFVNSRDDYTWSGDISTLGEELRAGYSLGIGSTDKKTKHEENPNQDWKDSILLTVAVRERLYDICASGDYANWAFPVYGREKIRDKFIDNLKKNDWSGAAADYLDSVESVLKVAAKGKQISFKNDTTGTLIGFLVPAALALLFGYGIAAGKRSSMQNTQRAKSAAEYVAGDNLKFTRREDRYIRTLVSRTYSPREKKGGGGGGSFSSSSGSSHTSGSF